MKHKAILIILAILWLSILWYPNTYATTMQPANPEVNNRWLVWISYIQRADRWADESRRLASRDEYQKILEAAKKYEWTEEAEPTQAEKNRKTATDYVLSNFGSEFKIDRVVAWAWKNKLRWSNQYKIKKTKIIIHHTADNNKNLPQTIEQEKEHMKNLYRFHAFSRWWWDIWYNFVIMPSWRIYEWRAGGAGVIWAHAAWNNTPSVWISLVWNFEEIEPTQEQIVALTNLATAVSKKYNINPLSEGRYFKTSSSYPFVVSEIHNAIAGHKDAWYTSCPWENLYKLLPSLRTVVAANLRLWATSIVWQNAISLPLSTQSSVSLGELKQNYISEKWFTKSQSNINRLLTAPKISDITTIVKKPVSVLLYEATTALNKWEISCTGQCVVRIGGTRRTANSLSVSKNNTNFIVTVWKSRFTTSRFAVSTSSNWIISITNYNRFASDKTPLNQFKQSLLFAYWPVKKINEEAQNMHYVANILSLDNYMRWVAEASDNQTQTKANILALLSKWYALYYMWWDTKHSSIPEWALYSAVDDPRIFQKYLGAWWEKISDKRPLALQQTRNQYITYNWLLPILPYFNCSAWFTRSADEKRWRKDTPYLQSVKDVHGVACDDFKWHWVGLSGEGSSALADQWKSVDEIIQYYYPWTKIVTVN